MVAFVGGLILIALGLAIRALNRIELALAARPMPRAARPGEAAAPSIPVVASLPTASLPPASLPPASLPTANLPPASVAAEEQASAAARIPFPPKPKVAVPTPAPAAASAVLPPPAAEAGFDLLREKFPDLARIDAAPAVAEGTDVSLLPAAPAHAEEHVAEAGNGVAVHHMNGTAAAKAAPRAEVAARPPAKPQKTSVFDTFWPKAQRASEAVAAVPAPVAVSPEPEELPQPSAPRIDMTPAPQPPQPAPVQRDVPRPVSVLKSGVVDGMAYTLYSDGSIEAQLPQGTLRFGSIIELRNHIEQTS
jgi:hypothetical protein